MATAVANMNMVQRKIEPSGQIIIPGRGSVEASLQTIGTSVTNHHYRMIKKDILDGKYSSSDFWAAFQLARDQGFRTPTVKWIRETAAMISTSRPRKEKSQPRSGW